MYVGVSGDDEHIGVCDNAVKAKGNISFLVVPGIDERSKSKKIHITYRLNNLNNINTINKYIYSYKYVDNNGNVLKSENIIPDTFMDMTKTVEVTSDGELFVDIKMGDDEIVSDSQTIIKIDTLGPNVIVEKHNKTVRHNVVIPIEVTDIGSGVNYDSFTKNDILVYVGEHEINSFDLIQDNKTKKYSLEITSDLYNGKVTLKIPKNNILDMIKNGNDEFVMDDSVSILFDNTYYITYDANGGFLGVNSLLLVPYYYHYTDSKECNGTDAKKIPSYLYLTTSPNLQHNNFTITFKDDVSKSHDICYNYTTKNLLNLTTTDEKYTWNQNYQLVVAFNAKTTNHKSSSNKTQRFNLDFFNIGSTSDRIQGTYLPEIWPQVNEILSTVNWIVNKDSFSSKSAGSKDTINVRFFYNIGTSSFKSEIDISDVKIYLCPQNNCRLTDTGNVIYNSTYGNIPTPTRTGYTFLGWYTDKNGETKIDSTSKCVIANNHTLYARWSKQ